MTDFIFDRVENIVGREESAGYQHFLLLPQFGKKKAVFLGLLKLNLHIVWYSSNV